MVDGSFTEGFCFREVSGLHAGCEEYLNQTRAVLKSRNNGVEEDFCVLYRQNDRVLPLYFSRYDTELRRPTWVAFELTWQDIGMLLFLSVSPSLSRTRARAQTHADDSQGRPNARWTAPTGVVVATGDFVGPPPLSRGHFLANMFAGNRLRQVSTFTMINAAINFAQVRARVFCV